MTVAVEQEQEQMNGEETGKIINPSVYGCQILQEKTTLEQANDKSTNDARLIWYTVDGTDYIDLTSGRHHNFDMYYESTVLVRSRRLILVMGR